MHRKARIGSRKLDQVLLAGGALALTVVAFLLDTTLPPAFAWIAPGAAFAGSVFFTFRVLLQTRPLGERLADALPQAAEIAIGIALAVGALLLARAGPAIPGAVVAHMLLLLAGLLAVGLLVALTAGERRTVALAVSAAALAALAAYLALVGGPFVPLALVVAGLLAILLARDASMPLAPVAIGDLFVAAAFGAFALAAHPGGLPAALEGASAPALALAALAGVALGAPALLRAPASAARAPRVGVAYLVLFALVADLAGPTHAATIYVGLGGATAFLVAALFATRPLARAAPLRAVGRVLVALFLLYPFVMIGRALLPALAPAAALVERVAFPFMAAAALCVPLLLFYVGYLSAEGLDDLAGKPTLRGGGRRRAFAIAGAGALAGFVILMAISLLLARPEPAVRAIVVAGLGLLAGALLAAILAARGGEAAPRRALWAVLYGAIVGWYLGYSFIAYSFYDTIPVITAVIVAWGVVDTIAELPERLAKGRLFAANALWPILLMFAFLAPLALALAEGGGGGLLGGADAWWIVGLAVGAIVAPIVRARQAPSAA